MFATRGRTICFTSTFRKPMRISANDAAQAWPSVQKTITCSGVGLPAAIAIETSTSMTSGCSTVAIPISAKRLMPCRISRSTAE